MTGCLRTLCCALVVSCSPVIGSDRHDQAMLEAMAKQHAKAHGVPEGLVHRIIMRESRYNPRAMNRGNYGLMQIRHATARGLGYSGTASGLLDPQVNLTYGVPYLANAYRVAGRNQDRAVALYSSGYYYEAKRKGMLGVLTTARHVVAPHAAPEAAASPPPLPALLTAIFSPPIQGSQQVSPDASRLAVQQGDPAVERKRTRRKAPVLTRRDAPAGVVATTPIIAKTPAHSRRPPNRTNARQPVLKQSAAD